MTGILAFIVVFGVLVTVHEFGHMFFAKRAGIMCPEFAIGMGPKIFSYKYNDTQYTVRLLPIGGYVRMASKDMEVNPLNAGMRINIKLNQNDEITHILLDDKHNFQHVEEIEVVDSDISERMYVTGLKLNDNSEATYYFSDECYFVENSELERIAPLSGRFESKSVWQRFLTLFAGPLFNFLLAFVLFTILFYIQGKPVDEPIVGTVMEDTPAAEINLEEGDRIRSIDGTEVDSWSHMTQLIQEGEGNPQELMIESGEESRTATLEPTVESTELPDGTVQERLIIGVGRDFEDGVIAPVWWGIEETVSSMSLIFELVVNMIGTIFAGTFSFDMLNGPVGIYKVTETVASQGILVLMNFTALLSVNLGIMNLLPIPALDGGRILFVLYEGIFRRPLNRKVELNIQLIGVLFVLVIMVLVTWNDIKTFFL
ncbi:MULTISPECIES: RIP metalloprotease RseP [Jeotgalicoccus]|uniref:Zinc metalloprotease n=1 Tax=Jeotgalicoccus nanhaiensis TaxID=568603 RepID=A0ABR9XUT7_9STAP|nr:RIP metalloprotease RseP [Jeotgalicoccus nanhaiensis]MBF0752674.1 RIP metalloprotease RseP [Jeotgalicoccus nanhaiensis]MDO5359530.1 RIP metalloprotease RseP [Jeotgalicoccus sp.]TFU62847.1 RIP metalloprotease RseP [Jeotgalicoccus nanhaiensis]